MKKTILTLILLTTLLVACQKPDESNLGFAHSRFFPIWIIEPGDSMQDNSTISRYSPYNDSMWYDAYAAANGQKLNVYINKGISEGEEFWLLAPKADKVLVLDAETMGVKTIINNLSSPQSICASRENIYVGSKQKAIVYKINKISYKVEEIRMPYKNITGIVYNSREDDTYVACHQPSCSSVYILKDNLPNISDSIYVEGGAPYECVTHDRTDPYFLSGDYESGVPYRLHTWIGTSNNTHYYLLDSAWKYSKMQLISSGSSNRDYIFFLIEGVNQADNRKVAYLKTEVFNNYTMKIYYETLLNRLSEIYDYWEFEKYSYTYILGKSAATGKIIADHKNRQYLQDKYILNLRDSNSVLIAKETYLKYNT